MRRAGEAGAKTAEVPLGGGLTPREWWQVGYADGLLAQPAAPAYRPPTPLLAGCYARGRVAGTAERERRLGLAARADSALGRGPT